MSDPFNKPAFLSTNHSNKRKAAPGASVEQYLKAPKHSANGDVKGGQHLPYVEDDPEVDDDDEEAGPELPPDDDAEDDEGDDEEGRFFGGGVTKQTRNALDYIEEREGEVAVQDKFDLAWLRRTALKLDRQINKNAELRGQYGDDVKMFMDSEADLDAEIKDLSILSQHPELYQAFAETGAVASLVGLLAHDNMDIAIHVLEILSELTDEDATLDAEAPDKQWEALVDAAMDADLPDLLLSTIKRLNEEDENDASGMDHSLSLLENLASRLKYSEAVVRESNILRWLVERVDKDETSLLKELGTGATVTQIKSTAAEVLSVLLQESAANRKKAVGLSTIETLLNQLSKYRKINPPNPDEREYAANLFDCLTYLVEEPEGKDDFSSDETEGVELCVMMVQEGSWSRSRALRVLDHATGASFGGLTCKRFVEVAGLKPLFSRFQKFEDGTMLALILSIFSSLLRSLPADSAERIRTIAKFTEKDYEKSRKLLRLRKEFSEKLPVLEDTIEQERAELPEMNPSQMVQIEDKWMERRRKAGLDCLPLIDVVLAWLVIEDDGISGLVESFSEGILSSIGDSLERQLEDLSDEQSEESKAIAEMLESIIDYLKDS